MPSIPRLSRFEADDPFAPLFVSVSELTERIKRTLETNFAEVAVQGELSKRRPAAVGARLLHAQRRDGFDPWCHVEKRREPAHF